ncbi:MAG: hypothetical protein JG777_1783 [Clostridia bacterium]|jgi:hypothetical protein|nr:hypothetical protein [Clostridia bacterium]
MGEFVKRYKIVFVLIGLAIAIILLSYLSIGGLNNRLFAKEQAPKSETDIKEPEKNNENVPAEPKQQTEQPQTDSNTNQEPAKQEPVNQEPVKQEPVKKEPVKVKGIYVTGWIAGTKTRFNQLVDLVNRTELNAMVIDVKEDRGKMTYISNVLLAKELGASVNMVGDIQQLMATLKENNIYPIARVVSFKDPIASEKRPELAIKTKDGTIWRDKKGNAWLNPYNKETWKYLIDISKEAVQLGFKEIQYDYVRFPTDGNVKIIDYGEIGKTKTKAEAISEFLAYAKKELEPLGIDVSADIFGIVPVVEGDYEQIGQDLEMVSKDIDYICPMVYPSHYANVAQNGVGQKVNGVLFKYPDLEPYGVVYNTLVLAKERLEKSQAKAKIRPWLQDFTASYLGKGNYQIYGGQQVRQQIKATYDAGLEEWILWDPDTKYSEDGLLKE